MSLHDRRQLVDPDRLARFAANTRIRWRRAWLRDAYHGHLEPGGDHLVTVTRGQDDTWTVQPDADAVFDLGGAVERLTVPGEFPTAEQAMRACDGELAALLRRLTGARPGEVTR